MAFCPEHPKCDQNLKFTPLIKRDDEHPRPLHKGVPPAILELTKRELERPHLFLGWLTREALVNYWQIILQNSNRLSFVLISYGEWVFKATFRLKENLVPRDPRVTLVKRSWERDWFLECGCHVSNQPRSPRGRKSGWHKWCHESSARA